MVRVITLSWFYDTKSETALFDEDVHVLYLSNGFSARHFKSLFFTPLYVHQFEKLRKFTSYIYSSALVPELITRDKIMLFNCNG